MGVSVADRRIAALCRTIERRVRLEKGLRATLATQREAHARIEAQRDDKHATVQRERDLLLACHERIAQLMSGGKAFALAEMNASMRHAETVADRLRAAEAELATLEQAVQARALEVAATLRAIANNRGRIDICTQRVVEIRRTVAHAASDAADEEAEEAALARMRFNARSTV
ncbi:type III secretion protein [Paraburkholderia fungorum]|uniref:type III secretion protein n=1 Tax=Paraburkholderia fungorum TaxID=134537 RepID=UPI0038BA17CE